MQLRKPTPFSESEASPNSGDHSNEVCQHAKGGRVIWDVTKPNADGVARQDPAEFVFNGPSPIGSLRPGEASQEYPARCLIYVPDETQVEIFSTYTPVKDRWYLESGGTAFSFQSLDISQKNHGAKVQVAFFSRGTGRVVQGHGRFPIVTPIDAGEYAEFDPESFSLVHKLEADAAHAAVSVDKAGMYMVTFQGTLTYTDSTPAEPSQGQAMSVALYQKDPPDDDGTEHDWTAAGYTAACNIIKDTKSTWNGSANVDATVYALKTYHVAFAGFVNLKADAKLAIKNTCGKKIDVDGLLSVAAIGAYYSPPATQS
jgi:hypothetical protein